MKISNGIIVASSLLLAVAGCKECPPQPASLAYRIDVKPGDSIERALEQIRKLPASNRVHGVELVFAPGEYRLNKTIRLDSKDSGTTNAPIVWRAAVPGKSVFTTAVRVPASRFKKVTDEAVLAKMPPEGRGKAYVADIADLIAAESTEGMELILDGDFADLARWPNGGEYTSFKGSVDVGKEVGPSVFEKGAFVYSNPRAKRWDFKKGVKLYGFFTHDWASYSAESHSYGTENGTNDVLRISTRLAYGVGGKTFGLPYRRFYVYDILEELDAPREYWFDRDAKLLYVVPEHGAFAPDADIRIATKRKDPMIDASAQLHSVHLKDLAFIGHNGPALDFRYMLDDIRLENCRFHGIVGTAFRYDGSNLLVTGCEMRSLGSIGIHLAGGDRKKLIRSGNVVENNRIIRFGQRQRTYAGAMEVAGCGHVIRRNEFADSPHHAMRYETNDTIIEYNNVHHVLLETGDAGAIYTGRRCTTQGNILRYNFIHELGDTEKSDKARSMGLYFDDCDCGDEVYGNVFWKCPCGIMLGGGRDHPIHDNIFAESRIAISFDMRGITWGSFYTLRPNAKSCYQPIQMKEMKVTEEPWKSRYPHLANQMNDDPGVPYDNPMERNVFLDCTQSLIKLGYDGWEKYLPRMTFADNVILTSSDVTSAKPDKRLVHGFTTCSNDVSKIFRDAKAGDFRPTPDSELFKLLPSYRTIPWEEMPRK